MKRLEDVKKGAACCLDINGECKDACPDYEIKHCSAALKQDVLAAFDQLEQEKTTLLEALKTTDDTCEYCKYAPQPSAPCEAVDFNCEACESKCRCYACKDGSNWEYGKPEMLGR